MTTNQSRRVVTESSEFIEDNIDLQAMLIDVIGLAKLSILQGNGMTKEDFVAWVKEIWDEVKAEQVKERMQ